MSPEDFDKLVDEALRRAVAPGFRRRLRNLVFVVEQEAPSPALLGLYQGRPATERSTAEFSSMPDRIIIYQGPHERMARNPTHLRRLVEETVWHEVAHYFGMSEAQVRRAEAKRERVDLRRRGLK
ncbi:MAG TPA: metallopeptidase family protein [Bryobacteraceae bacterium]|nr:metallopeptidase family protein [Bryobacteraceae bacterium]HPT25350.1 metallopeptidase family protein [Bryobacteraceae bacterium]